MTGEAPSLAAQRVAMRRAPHQLFGDPRVFEDALAIAILGEEAAAKLKSGLDRFETPGSRHTPRFHGRRQPLCGR
jgi:hypothetical protein